jgi:hypothetical protein
MAGQPANVIFIGAADSSNAGYCHASLPQDLHSVLHTYGPMLSEENQIIRAYLDLEVCAWRWLDSRATVSFDYAGNTFSTFSPFLTKVKVEKTFFPPGTDGLVRPCMTRRKTRPVSEKLFGPWCSNSSNRGVLPVLPSQQLEIKLPSRPSA